MIRRAHRWLRDDAHLGVLVGLWLAAAALVVDGVAGIIQDVLR